MELRDVYNIVVLGAMNPRIHHPMWYRLVGLITPEEADAAISLPGLLTTPHFSQFESNSFILVCQDDRWEIRTSDPGQLKRLHEIFVKVFDDILPHTPVSVVGFNFMFSRATRSNDVGSLLAKCILATPLGLNDSEVTGGEVVLRRVDNDRTALVSVKAVPEEPGALFVANNYEYRIKASEAFQNFKLADVLSGRYEIDRLDAAEQTASILEAVNNVARI